MRLIDPSDFPAVTPTPTHDLIEVYKTCLLIQDLCVRRRVGGLSAPQVGVPWALSVCCLKPGDWRYFLNHSYTPVSTEKKPALVRFVNVEAESPRYFMVRRYEHVQYHAHELVVRSQPELIPITGTDPALGLFLQNESELLAGNLPHVDGVEYFVRNLS